MKFRRLKVSHYKGVRHIEVAFAPTGITLVLGPNEAGKSSLVQAITTLFDDSVHRQRNSLAHLIPKDGGGFPEIELEAESGGYHFTFHKRFIEKRLTELTIHSHGDEFHSGREAQDRFEAILRETLDLTLWRALMLQQGSAIGLPEVRDQTALMTALDNSVAGSTANGDAESLFHLVEEEYRKYFHSGTGAELQEMKTMRRDVLESAARVEEYEKLLSELENRTGRARQLRLDLLSYRERRSGDAAMLDECRARVAEIDTLEKALEAENAKRERAEQAQRGAKRDLEDRKTLNRSGMQERERVAKAAQEAVEAAMAQEEAMAVALEKKARFNELDVLRKEREILAVLRRTDYEYYLNALELERMRERKGYIEASRASLKEAEAELAVNFVTEAAEKDIREAEQRVAMVKAKLGASSPDVRLKALSDCTVIVDGEGQAFTRGETRRISVNDAMRLEIPQLLVVEMNAGAGTEKFRDELRGAEEALQAVLSRYAVASASEVSVLRERRREAERACTEHERVKKEHLRDLSFDGEEGSLVERIRRLETVVAAYMRSRAATPAMAPDLDAAATLRDLAEEARQEAVQVCAEAENEWRIADDIRQEAKDRRTRYEAEKNSAESALHRSSRLLEDIAARTPDHDLEEALLAADGELSAAAAAIAVLNQKLRGLGPEQARERLGFLEGGLERVAAEERAAREELARVEGELQQQGGNGLGEKLEEAKSLHDHGQAKLNAILRRAEAAKLLYEALSEARGKSQKAYIVPLRNRIDDLAHSVYNTPVSVRLDDQLKIVTRTLDGVEIDFAHLSGGAQEQFSLMHRAACSLMVSDDGGVPLILDDALGYSDHERLWGMNLVLERAARACQIIILTCMPERYRHLTPAMTIQLQKSGAHV